MADTELNAEDADDESAIFAGNDDDNENDENNDDLSKDKMIKKKAKTTPPRWAKWATSPFRSIIKVKPPSRNTRYFALMGIGGIINIISISGNSIPKPIKIP